MAAVPAREQGAYLILADVQKSYGRLAALQDLSAHIGRGELVSLLGPSGSGKTTALRIIGGFLEPDAGRVIIGGRDVTLLPPHRRNIGTVFQSYGLFPHMTVQQNVAYGLRMRRVPRAEQAMRIAEVLAMVRLSGLNARYPRELSGGQQQRVAIARALVIRPALLLLDEPMSNLDAKLRGEMRQDIRRLQQETRLTTVLVTHDQDEALSISDRIIVMNEGRVEQIGTPATVYERPETLFVARFMGEANLLEGTVTTARADGVEFRTALGFSFRVGAQSAPNRDERITVSLRPESICFDSGSEREGRSDGHNRTEAVIEEVRYHGAFMVVRCRLSSGDTLRVVHPNRLLTEAGVAPIAGDPVRLRWEVAASQIVQ